MQPRDVIDLDLSRMNMLLRAVGNANHIVAGKAVIHITGTNGKGSCCEMIACILAQAGYSVGLFTSPSILEKEESIRIFGPDGVHRIQRRTFEFLSSFILQSWISKVSGKDMPTYFEVLTCIALLFFASSGVDFAVIEVGMGGRLDATNVFQKYAGLPGKSLCCVITSISLDHVHFLGDSPEAILLEKCGIFQENCQIFVPTSFSFACKQVVCRVQGKFSGKIHWVEESNCENVKCPLNGKHQISNMNLAIEIARYYQVDLSTVREGLARVHLPGRVEWVDFLGHDKILLDGSHNEDSVKFLIDFVVSAFPLFDESLKIYWILSFSLGKKVDKIIEKIMQKFPKSSICFCEFDDDSDSSWIKPQSIGSLVKISRKLKSIANFEGSLSHHARLYDALLSIFSDNETKLSLIVICGSLYLVRDFYRLKSGTCM